MINIIIDKQGRPSKGSIFLGNQHENLDETLQFFFPKEYENYYRYIAYCYKDRRTGKKITGISPLVEDAFKVTSAITKCAGMWQLYVICKTTQIDEKATIIDLTANNSTGEHIFISDAINGRISGNEIDIEAFENIAVDENIKILYDDILSLKLRVEKNEATRQTQENIRQTAEANRANAESQRVIAEQSRVDSEGLRTQSEESRVTAESKRVEVEKARVKSETLRGQSETARVNAENERVTAENLRAEAENRRDSVITKLREDLDANTKADGRTQRSLTALWGLNKGISYRFENDNGKAYMKTIPSGAKLGAVNKIGGRTIVYNQLFKTDNIDNGSITITYADNIVTINGTTSNNWINFSALDEKLNVVGKFYIKMIIIKNDDGLSFKYGWLHRSVYTDSITSGSVSTICSQTSSDLEKGLSTGISWAENTGSVTFNDVKIQITIVNLTKMFGEGNEPTTTQEFESMFPNAYYPYSEGELISMSVNEVDEIGKNIFKCKNFSCIGINDINNLTLNNSYGTSINNTEPSNSVMVTQSSVGEENINTSYKNGYFCVSFKPFVLSEDYMFSFDVIPSKKLIENAKIIILLNGSNTIIVSNTQDLQVGKRTRLCFNLTADNTKVIYIEFRNGGISGVFENFQIEKGSVNTAYAPYHEKAYPIPQAVQNLDGYGWSVGNVSNYVDYENKKFYKRVNRVDLSTLNFVYTAYGDKNDLYGFRAPLPKDIKNDENAYIKKNNLLCSKYPDTPWQDSYRGMDKTISQLSQSIQINDSSYSDADSFKNALKGVYLYYELAEPIVTDISDILEDTFQEPFVVESGGSLTFKNSNGDGYQVAVSSEVQYVVSLKEVNP